MSQIPTYHLKHREDFYLRRFETAVQRVLAARQADWAAWVEHHQPDADPYDFVTEQLWHATWVKDSKRRRPELWDWSAGFPGGISDDEYFSSGSNHEGEIKALALLGIHVGVAVDALDKKGAAEGVLKRLRGTRAKIFVDSGAFGEIDFSSGAPKVKVRAGKSYLITEAEWQHRLDIYRRLADALGPQLYVVAPDMIAHQQETLDRLTRWRSEIRDIAATGANVIVPVQQGSLADMVTFWAYELSVLGDTPAGWEETRSDYWRRNWKSEGLVGSPPWHQLSGSHLQSPRHCWIAGVPSKKGAATVDDVVKFVHGAAPERVHLLGKGRFSDDFQDWSERAKYTASLQGYHLGLSCDSVRISSMVGRDKIGKALPYRKITVMRDALVAAGRDPENTAALKEETVRRVFLNEQLERLDAAVDAGWRGGCYGQYDWEFISPGPDEDFAC